MFGNNGKVLNLKMLFLTKITKLLGPFEKPQPEKIIWNKTVHYLK